MGMPAFNFSVLHFYIMLASEKHLLKIVIHYENVFILDSQSSLYSA